MKTMLRFAALAAFAAFASTAARAQYPAQHAHGHDMPPAADTRQDVAFPEALRAQTLANMRDHLLALQEIQEALAHEDFDRAADTAERRLGMSSMQLHGAHEVAQFMPAGMQAVGSEMHRHASRFAVAAKEAAATGDMRPAIAALAEVTRRCVACHMSYRVR
jgi:hypothetical protein